MLSLSFQAICLCHINFGKRFEPTDILFSGATTADNAYAFRVLGLDKLSYLFNLGPSLGWRKNKSQREALNQDFGQAQPTLP